MKYFSLGMLVLLTACGVQRTDSSELQAARRTNVFTCTSRAQTDVLVLTGDGLSFLGFEADIGNPVNLADAWQTYIALGNSRGEMATFRVDTPMLKGRDGQVVATVQRRDGSVKFTQVYSCILGGAQG